MNDNIGNQLRHPKRIELDNKWRNHEISHREYVRRSRILRLKGI